MRVLPLEATGHPRQAPELAAGIRLGYLVSLCEPSEGPEDLQKCREFRPFPGAKSDQANSAKYSYCRIRGRRRKQAKGLQVRIAKRDSS